MLRTTLDKAYLKRTIRPLYGWTQATPKSEFLDPAFDRGIDIWPGMVATTTGAASGTVTPAVADGDIPTGLFGLYIGGDGIDEILDQGVNAVAVWVMGPDAEFEIVSPAFEESDGTFVENALLHFLGTGAGDDRGKICPADATNASTRPLAKLIKIVSTDKLIIGGLQGTLV